MTACTYLATVSVALATAGITIIFDEGKMARIESLAVRQCADLDLSCACDVSAYVCA